MSGSAFIHGDGDATNALVVVFLRGGADGLNMVVPIEDDAYYSARPLVGISKRNAVPLDDLFALNPRLAPLADLYRDGDLAIVHCAGSEDQTRSHFEAQDAMEHGGAGGGGWLGRYLRHRPNGPGGPLSAVAIGSAAPEALRGAPAAVVMESFADFALGERAPTAMAALERLYAPEADALGGAARATIAALGKIAQLNERDYTPANGAQYPQSQFGDGLCRIAQMVKANVGLESACLDLGGWDAHFASGTLMDPLMDDLSKGLTAFHTDLNGAMRNTTVVVMTEFGRRVYENASLGTDHGRASVMFAIGGGVRGGKVYCDWPGLALDKLEAPGDLPVQHNYRDVLAPVLARHSGITDFSRVFPDYDLSPLDLLA
ncbi:MAG: DUF1501 domain-containing protein [Candidatus Hydrogenedentes bacterium]|nr:DUF1501 domain-containing protein [Candidatus Hydrogenedentota bacterium]